MTTEYHIDDDGNLILDELGRPIPNTVCLCYAHEPSECMCGAWDDIAYDWYELLEHFDDEESEE